MTVRTIKYFFFILFFAPPLFSQSFIKKINYNYEKPDSLFLTNIFAAIEEKEFSEAIVEETISTALDYFENSGFPFAAIKIESIYFHTDSTEQKNLADIYLNISKGEPGRFDKIMIEGNTKTKDFVILRELRNVQSNLYSQKKIDDIPALLNRLRFFEPVEKPTYFVNSKNEGVLKIIVKEKETNNFDGVVGYVPSSNSDEKGFFTGYVNISLRNLLGTGRAAAVRWLQENRNSQELEVRYIEPWLFGYPFNIEMGLFQRKQDSTYVQRTFEGKIDFLATQEITASLSINTLSTIPTERKNKVFTVYNSDALTTGFNFKIDTRDDFYAPTAGFLLINSYKYTSKNINGPAEYVSSSTKTKVNFQRLEVDFGYFQKIFERQILAAGIHARELRGSDVEISDMYFLGGTNSLRGYREKQFTAGRVAWTNIEYRYLLSRRSFAFLFFDTGYYLRNENIENNITKLEGFKIGYGLGLNIETGLGVLGVSFALAKGDSFSDGKIHFGIVNEF